jgi:hypothetical protein
MRTTLIRYSPAAAANLKIRMAVSGHMMAQDMHAVHLDSSKHPAYGTPWRLKLSRDIESIFSGQAPMQSVQPLHRSRLISGLPLDTEMLLYHDRNPEYHFPHFVARKSAA